MSEKGQSILIRKWGFCSKRRREKKNYLSGLIMARWRSTAIAVSVNTDTFTLTVWTNGQKAHINSGKFHRWSNAAWNCIKEQENRNGERSEKKKKWKRNKMKTIKNNETAKAFISKVFILINGEIFEVEFCSFSWLPFSWKYNQTRAYRTHYTNQRIKRKFQNQPKINRR